MIKGCRKNMIAVKGEDNDIFETAYFILKDSCGEVNMTESDILLEAEKIIEKSLLSNEIASSSKKKRKNKGSEKKGSRSILPFAAGATVGSAVGLLWLFL